MAEFIPMDLARARAFVARHHRAVLATRRKNGGLQMSPLTPGLDDDGRVIISSRETAIKVKNLRRDSTAALCVFTDAFHGGGWAQINGTAQIISLPSAMETLIYLERQVKGEHRNWQEFRERMVRERRVIIRIDITSVGPLRRG